MNDAIQGDEIRSLSKKRHGTELDGEGDIDFLTKEISARKGLACFAIWEEGRSKEKEIIDELKQSFNIIADFLIYWTDENYNRNIHRLYQRAQGSTEFKGYHNKIGRPPFRFLIVEDFNPSYTLMKNVSGLIETSNKNVVTKKYEFRSWFEKEYQVHSSNNNSEFIFQTTLVLGTALLDEALTSPCLVTKEIHQDLQGANGWRSWKDLFSILNRCSNYLILRNFENLPMESGAGDVDFLCNDYQRLASSANIYQKKTKPYKGVVRVAGSDISIDIRFVGDGYYPCSWQKDMLSRRRKYKGVYVLPPDDYFFTVLYHCKLHKGDVDEKYRNLLVNIAHEMQWDWFSDVDIDDDLQVVNLLKGYLQSNKYYFEIPIDSGVYRNEKFIKKINIGSFWEVDEGRLVKLLRKHKRVYKKIQKKINRQLWSRIK